jgi:large subunit ribosomal protein L5
MNIMKEIQIQKVTLNFGAGKPGQDLEKGKILLTKISGMKPAETRTKKRIPGWSLRPNLVIGAKVTMRGPKSYEVLAALLEAKDFMLSQKAFDNNGNFSFGVHEYLDIPTLDYIPEVGMKGLEIAVTLQRKGGARLTRRALQKKKIPQRHRVSKIEALKFAKAKLKVQISEELEEDEE